MPPSASWSPVADELTVLGVRVHRVSSAQALDIIDDFVRSAKPHHVATVNPEYIVQARGDPEFAAVLSQVDLALPDGVGLLWAARYLGHPLPERVTGVDTMQRLAGLAAEQGYRVFLLGAREGVAERTAQCLTERYPGLIVAGTYAGSPAAAEEVGIVDRVQKARPQVLFVAYGAPEQDKWIRRNLERLNVPVAMGVGGAFDFISGRTQRAPALMQRLGLEWLHRLWSEPWRWRRMLRLPLFVWLVLRSRR